MAKSTIYFTHPLRSDFPTNPPIYKPTKRGENMGPPSQTTQTLEEVISKTNSDIVLFTIVIILGLTAALPSLVLFLKAKSADAHLRHKELMERESEARKREETLLNVVKGNTAAMVKLTTLLETNSQDCSECRVEQSSINKDVLERIEAIHLDVVKIKERL